MRTRLLTAILFLLIGAACSSSTEKGIYTENSCLPTEPQWSKPPEDAALSGPPEYGYYFVNADQFIWASAWQVKDAENPFRAGDEGNKISWFRPEGAEWMITGRRLDAEAPSLEAKTGCNYPTRFQASGMYFPTEGCWEIIAHAQDRELTFIVWVEP